MQRERASNPKIYVDAQILRPAETITPPERLNKRKEFLITVNSISTLASYIMYVHSVSLENRIKIDDPANFDHGEKHTNDIKALNRLFWHNVAAVTFTDKAFARSMLLNRCIHDGIMWHDSVEVTDAYKYGHDCAAALLYAERAVQFRDNLHEVGTDAHKEFTIYEKAARESFIKLRKFVTDTRDIKIIDEFIGNTNETPSEEIRRQVSITAINILSIIAAHGSPDDNRNAGMIYQYLAYLDSYNLDNYQIQAAATIIMNHGDPQKIADCGVEQYTPQLAIDKLIKSLKSDKKIKSPNLENVFEKFPSLREIQGQIRAKRYENHPIRGMNKNEQLLNELWTKYFTAIDLYYTIGPVGMASVIRTMESSTKMLDQRALYIENKKTGKTGLISIEADFEKRSTLVDSNGNPRHFYEDDISRWLAEANLPFAELCSDAWFLALVGETISNRFQSINDVIKAIASKDYVYIWNHYENYKTKDIAMMKRKYRGTGPMASFNRDEMLKKINERYKDEEARIARIVAVKKRKYFHHKRNAHRINELLLRARIKNLKKYPNLEREQLEGMGYEIDTDKMYSPFLLVTDTGDVSTYI